MTEKEKETKVEVKKGLLVVSELPKVETAEILDRDGKVYECVTVNDALQEILESIREIRARL